MPFVFKKSISARRNKTVREKARDWVTRRALYPEVSAAVQMVKGVLSWPRPQFVPSSISFKQWLEKLQEKGRGASSRYYESSDYGHLAYVYLMKKYGNMCVLHRIPATDDILIYRANGAGSLQHNDSLPFELRQCLHHGSNLILIPLNIQFEQEAHQNILIYRPSHHTIERFEPHGYRTVYEGFDDRVLDTALREFFEGTIASLVDPDLSYRPPADLYPLFEVKGPQAIENLFPKSNGEEGRCLGWTLLVAETLLMNPDVSTADVIQQCLEFGRRNPAYFYDLIVGYTQQLAEELKTNFLKEHHPECALGAKGSKCVFTAQLLDMPAVSRVVAHAEGVNSKSLSTEDLGILHKIIKKLDEGTLNRYLQWVETGKLPKHRTSYQKTTDVDDLREALFEALVSRGMSWGMVQTQLDALEGGSKKRIYKTKRRRNI
jgi:hypothetical protein